MGDQNAVCGLLSLYAIGVLPPPESGRFEGHLAACVSCQTELEALTNVTHALAVAAAEPAEPSPGVRERILAAIAGPGAAREGTSRSFRLRSGWRSLAAAAAIFLAIALTVDDLRVRRSNVAALAVLGAPDLARVDLAGQQAAPGAAARVFWSRSHGLVFTASGLPELPAGRTYQLWAVTAQKPISTGLVAPDRHGRATAIFHTPADMPDPIAMAVTIEPESGVPAPTGDKYLIGEAK
jgi:anti-sigma-K factor RskA